MAKITGPFIHKEQQKAIKYLTNRGYVHTDNARNGKQFERLVDDNFVSKMVVTRYGRILRYKLEQATVFDLSRLR